MTKRVWFISLLLVLIVIGAQAQEDVPSLFLISETLIGSDESVGALLQPDADAVWVMTTSLYREHYTLHSFSTVTGERIGEPISTFDDPNPDYFRLFSSNTLIQAPDGTLQLILDENSTDLPAAYTINPQTGESTRNADADAQLGAFFREFTPYMEGLSFSTDHRYLVASDDHDLDVIDLVSRSRLFTLPYDTLWYGFAASQQLFVIISGDAATTGFVLNVYSLPDGALTQSYLLPQGGIPYPSDDGRFVAMQITLDEAHLLGVFDTTTGVMSSLLSMDTPPFTVEDCTVRDSVTDAALHLDRGYLSIQDVVWLPDGETFMAISQYIGDGMTQGREEGCELTASRISIYRISTE